MVSESHLIRLLFPLSASISASTFPESPSVPAVIFFPFECAFVEEDPLSTILLLLCLDLLIFLLLVCNANKGLLLLELLLFFPATVLRDFFFLEDLFLSRNCASTSDEWMVEEFDDEELSSDESLVDDEDDEE